MSEVQVDLWGRVTSQEALQAAWHRVQENGGGPGGDLVGLDDFRSDLFANLTQLRAELLGGTYRSGPFRRVTVPKKKPGYRTLTIPSIRDRVVHTALAVALTPILEATFEDCSFAYRPGRGVVHAVERIERWRKRGFDIVIEAEIVGYFDNVDQVLLMEKLRGVIAPLDGAAPVLALVEVILADQAHALGTPGLGLVQGSPLSPLLANLHLDALDEEIESEGVKIVRYADDFVVLCRSEKTARKALETCTRVLAAHGLRLHEDGTRIVSFDKGFDFIGYLFLRTLALKKDTPETRTTSRPVKSIVTDEGVITLEDAGSRFDPGARVLYVLDPTHQLTVRNRSFSVLREDGSELIAVPHARVGRIEIGPEPTFPRNLLDLALQTGVDVSLVDGFGQTRGIVLRGDGKRAGIQLAQAAAVLDDGMRTALARRIAEARIRNQRTQLFRLNREPGQTGVRSVLDEMGRHLRKLETATCVEELRGIEGAATAAYWPALAALAQDPPEAPFKRTRPARDPFNAAINYLTGILERDVRAAILAAGLHPGFAFLHGSRDRHDGFVYDLMEPFRAPLTEGLAVYLLNARRLRPEMFGADGSGMALITAEGRRALVVGYETAVARRVNRPDGAGKLAWRPMMLQQAHALRSAVVDAAPDGFLPYLMEA